MSDPRNPSGPDDGLPPELDPRRGRPSRGGRSERDSRARDPRPRSRSEDELPPELDPRRSRRHESDRAQSSRSASSRSASSRAQGSRAQSSGAQNSRTPGGRPGSTRDRRAVAATTAPRRRRPGTVVKVIAAVVSVGVLITSGALWGLYRQVNANVTHIAALPEDSQNHVGSDVDGSAQNILLVGNDSRGGLSDAELKEVGTEANAGFNTDTMLVLHIPANGKKATVVSLPRDSYVTVPGVGQTKLNAAYADGACIPNACGNELTEAQKSAGAKKLVATVSGVTGLHIDHYVEVGLLGFYRITNLLGGVEVCLKAPAKDSYSGIDLPAGKQKIEGTQALAFVRQRHGLPHGDLDRVKRQQAFLGAVADKVLSADTLLNPFKLKKLLNATAKSLTVDKNLDLIKLAAQMRDLAAGNVTFTTMPTLPGANIDGRDVLPLNDAAVKAFFAQVAGKKQASGAPASGTVHTSAGTIRPAANTVTTAESDADRTASDTSCVY